MNESVARDSIVAAAHSIHRRGLTHGRTGNLSIRVGDEVVITPTGSSLGELVPGDLSVIDMAGRHLRGPRPSKEAFLHTAMLRARPDDRGVAHTHSTYAAAVSCMASLDPEDALPPLTAYFAMRVGHLGVLPYHAPGDEALGPAAEAAALTRSALLLRNHGAITSAATLPAALDAIEELEQTAKLFLVLDGHATQPLDSEQVRALRTRS